MRLKNVCLGGAVHPLENLVLIIGPNGTGKTTLLSDLFVQAITHTRHTTSSGITRKWHEAMFKDDFCELDREEFRVWRQEQEPIHGVMVGNNKKQYASKYSYSQSQGYGIDEHILEKLEPLISNKSYDLENDGTYAPKIKATYFTHLNIETRFRLSSEAGFTFFERKPSSLFFHNDKLLPVINKYLSLYFGKRLFIEYSSDTNYELLIGSSNTQPPKIYRHDSKGIARTLAEHKQWREIHTDVQKLNEEGHGIRAFIEVMAALTDPYQKVVFIDEPELHLYPDIKRRLGRDIARISKRKQIFMVTHDTDIIDGIVNVENPFDILRVKPNKNVDIFKFRPKEIKTLHAERKSPDALKVGFYDCAVFVEGVGERYVYGNAISSKHLLDDKSYTVVACHGKDRVSNHMKFALALNMPSVVIMDYDAIYNDKEALRRVLETLLGYPQFQSHKSLIENLIKDATEIKLLTQGIQNKTKGLGGDLGRYPQGVVNKITDLITQLKKVGVYLVPIGELEDWVGARKGTAPEQVLGKYLSRSNSTYKGLTTFLNEVADDLKLQIQASS